MANYSKDAERITKRKARQKKKRVKNWIIKGLAAVVVIYLALSVIFSVHSGITTVIALNGTVNESVAADGYIFRQQTLINSPANGYIECRVGEGERVSIGETVGYIYTGEYDASRAQKMQELNDRIDYLENNSAVSASYVNNSVMVEQKISSAVRNISDERHNHDLKNMPQNKENLNILIERKKAMENGGTLDKDEMITQLKNQLSELEGASGGAKIVLTADAGGVFSSRIDGFENDLTFDVADKLTPSYLKELDAKQIQHSETVAENQPVCKIVDNYEWYFGAVFDAEYAKNLKIGQRVEMDFFDFSSAPVYGNIKRISEEEKGKVAVTIYANRYVDGIYSSSRAAAEITTTSAEGIKLPVKSLHVKDEQTGVYVLRLGVARFVPVNVRYKNDEWAVVSAVTDTGSEYRLQIYDEVVVDAKNLEDGKVVR